MDELNLFNGLNLNPIHFDFTRSLTTTEWLGAIQAKVNECVNFANNLVGSSNDYTDNEINKIRLYILQEVTTLNTLITTNLTNSKSYTVSSCTNVLNKAYLYADTLYNTLKDLHTADIADVKNLVNDKYNELVKLIEQNETLVINPITGNKTTVQVAINNIYDFLRDNVYTCSELDALELTCLDYDNKEITAQIFDLSNKTVLN